jgi:AraC-like DNA-binding protein/uncharacterized RmlC-like cupin family protein
MDQIGDKIGMDDAEQIQFSFCGYYNIKIRPVVETHIHRGVEVVYFAQGTCSISFDNGQTFECRPGNVMVTPPGLPHRQYNNSADCETWYVVFDGGTNSREYSLRMFNLGNEQIIPQWFHQIYELSTHNDYKYAAALTTLLWQRLLEHENSEHLKHGLHPALQKALKIMANRFHEQITIKELAQQCFVSVSLLNMLFNIQLAICPQRYLLSLRMREARRLLVDNTYRVAEVALRTGFSNSNYFIRAFKKYHGVSPSAYRRDPLEFVDHTKYLLP